jgi:hypothetical protein
MDAAQLSTLQGHARTLSDLHDSLQSLRQIPSRLLQPPIQTPAVMHQFQQLKVFGEILCSDESQTALQSAQDSEKADKNDLNPNFRRQNRKRRYIHRNFHMQKNFEKFT